MVKPQDSGWESWIEFQVERSLLVVQATLAGIRVGEEMTTAQLAMSYMVHPKAASRGQYAASDLAAMLLVEPFITGKVELVHEGLQQIATRLEGGWLSPRMLSITQRLMGRLIAKVSNADDAAHVLGRILSHPHIRSLLCKPGSPLADHALGKAAAYPHEARMWPQTWLRLLLENGVQPSAAPDAQGRTLLQRVCSDITISQKVTAMIDLEQQHPLLSALADHGHNDWITPNARGQVARDYLPTALGHAARPAELRAQQRKLDHILPSPASSATTPRF